MKSFLRFSFLVLLLFLFQSNTLAQWIHGQLDINDPKQYHLIKLKGKARFKTKIIAINKEGVSYLMGKDTVTSLVGDVKEIFVRNKGKSYSDEKQVNVNDSLLILMKSGSQLIGRLDSLKNQHIHFHVNGLDLRLSKRAIRKTYLLKDNSTAIKHKVSLYTNPYRAAGNNFATPTGHIADSRQLEYRSFGGLVHSLESPITRYGSLTAGFSLPNVLFGRAKASLPLGKKTFISSAYTIVRTRVNNNYELSAAHFVFTQGTPSKYFNLSLTRLWVTNTNFSSNRIQSKRWMLNLGGALKLSNRWSVQYSAYFFEDDYDDFISIPTLAASWNKNGNMITFGTSFFIITEDYTYPFPYASFKKRLYR